MAIIVCYILMKYSTIISNIFFYSVHTFFYINQIIIFIGQPGTPGLPGSVYQPSYQKPISNNQYGNPSPYPGSSYPGSQGNNILN